MAIGLCQLLPTLLPAGSKEKYSSISLVSNQNLLPWPAVTDKKQRNMVGLVPGFSSIRIFMPREEAKTKRDQFKAQESIPRNEFRQPMPKAGSQSTVAQQFLKIHSYRMSLKYTEVLPYTRNSGMFSVCDFRYTELNCGHIRLYLYKLA